MASPELQKYVTDARQRGISDEVIRQELLKAGWNLVDIAGVLKPSPITDPSPTRAKPIEVTAPTNLVEVKPRRSLKLLLVSIIVVVLIGGGAAFAFTTETGKVFSQKVVAIFHPTTELESASGIKEISDWQTYKNENFGIEIRYPNGWLVGTNKGDYVVSFVSTTPEALASSQKPEVFSTVSLVVRHAKPSEGSNQISAASTELGAKVEEKLLNGRTAVRYEYSPGNLGSVYEEYYVVYLFTDTNDVSYELVSNLVTKSRSLPAFKEQIRLFDKLAETFKSKFNSWEPLMANLNCTVFDQTSQTGIKMECHLAHYKKANTTITSYCNQFSDERSSDGAPGEKSFCSWAVGSDVLENARRTAGNTGNLSECDKIDDPALAQNCKESLLGSSSIKEVDISICLKTESDLKEDCYKKAIAGAKGVSVCANLPSTKDTGAALSERDMCYFTASRSLSDVLICTKISNDFHRSVCYAEVAQNTNNRDVCELVPMSNNWRYECYWRLGVTFKDANLCEKSYLSTYKNDCLKKIAQ